MCSSCCMVGCLFSQPAACPGISKGSYQACVIPPSIPHPPMQMAKLPLNMWSYQVAEHCLRGKGNGFFPLLPGMARELGSSSYWITPEASTGKQAWINSIKAPVWTAQAGLRGLETARYFSSVNLCSSWELLHSSTLWGENPMDVWAAQRNDQHLTQHGKQMCMWREETRQATNSVGKLCLFSRQPCHVIVTGRFIDSLLPTPQVVEHRQNQWTSLFPSLTDILILNYTAEFLF